MVKSNFQTSIWLVIWTCTFIAWAQWSHWAPHWGHLTKPEAFQRVQYDDLSYTAESPDWRLERFDTEGFKERLRSGRPVDTFVLSTLKMSVADLDHLTANSVPGKVLQLLNEKALIKYRPSLRMGGPEALAHESRIEALAPEPPLELADLRRINSDLLSSWYPLEFEKFPPKALPILIAPSQPLGFMDLRLRFKAQREESNGVLFQTANDNRGIRLELARLLSGSTELKVVVGWKSAKTGLGLGPANELVLSTDIDADQEHVVVIQYDSWGNLIAFFDDVYIGKIDDRRPMLDHVIIGNGDQGYRPFWGHIQLEHLELSVLPISSTSTLTRFGLSIYLGLLMAFINTLSLFQLLRRLVWSS